MKVYLAGPINACSDDEVTVWRAEVRELVEDLGHEVLDPADRDFRGVEAESFVDIVEGDKSDIDKCDVFFAYCWQPSYGTAMEILYAFIEERISIAVVPEGKPVSPWVQYHVTDVYRTLEAALDRLGEILKS